MLLVSESYEQGCPVAVALDLIGDRWTLLFLRDLTHAPMRFIDLQAYDYMAFMAACGTLAADAATLP